MDEQRGRPDIVVKELFCNSQAQEDLVRREAAAMKAVQSLEGCLPVLGTYADIWDEVDGGATYYLAMPCAFPASGHLLCRAFPCGGQCEHSQARGCLASRLVSCAALS